MLISHSRLLAFLLVTAVTGGNSWCVNGNDELAGATANSNDDKQLSRGESDERFASDLQSLALQADRLGLVPQAPQARSWQVARADDRQWLYLGEFEPLEQMENDHKSRAGESAERDAWAESFRQARRQQAQRLWEIAAAAATAGDFDTAYRLLFEITREDPTHPDALRQLGSSRPDLSSAARISPGRARHSQYGWEPNKYWIVESDHFRVSTSASAEAGEELTRQLEALYWVWRQVFVRYWAQDGALVRSWKTGKGLSIPSRRHQVVLFADRNEYIRHLQRYEPQIEVSLGVYRDSQRTAFFYHGDFAELKSTWLHEVTHQLFHEVVPVTQRVGEEHDFWLVEAAALYMESLVLYDGYCTVGGWESDRLQYARYRELIEGFRVPWSDLSQLGRVELQQHPELRRIYTQAAGMSHFLMDGQQGQYRRAFVDYLRDIYRNKSNTVTDWESRFGKQVESLGSEYQTFLDLNDDKLLALRRPEQIRHLSLGRTHVTDRGLQILQQCTRLEWLDVSFCDVGDEGVRLLDAAAPLRQLSVEGTRITDRTLDHLGGFVRLEELDLSQTEISDAGLANLSSLTELRSLWLTGTEVTDTGVRALVGLKKIELLDVGSTRVTPAGLDRVKAELPALRSEE